MKELNLLPEEIKKERKSKELNTAIIYIFSIFYLISVVFVAYPFYKSFELNKEKAKLTTQLEALKATNPEKPLNEINAFELKNSRKDKVLQKLSGKAFSGPEYIAINCLNSLENSMQGIDKIVLNQTNILKIKLGDNNFYSANSATGFIGLTNIEVSKDGEASITGNTDSMYRLSIFMSRLRKDDKIKDIKLESISVEEGNNEVKSKNASNVMSFAVKFTYSNK